MAPFSDVVRVGVEYLCDAIVHHVGVQGQKLQHLILLFHAPDLMPSKIVMDTNECTRRYPQVPTDSDIPTYTGRYRQVPTYTGRYRQIPTYTGK